mgnify:CR=1 FL=1
MHAQQGSARCVLFALAIDVRLAVAVAAENVSLVNPGFEDGRLEPWKHAGAVQVINKDAHGGKACLHFGDSPSWVEQTVQVKASSQYRLRAWLRSSSGALTVSIGVKNHDSPMRTISTPRVAWTLVELPFTTGPAASRAASAPARARAPVGPGGYRY